MYATTNYANLESHELEEMSPEQLIAAASRYQRATTGDDSHHQLLIPPHWYVEITYSTTYRGETLVSYLAPMVHACRIDESHPGKTYQELESLCDEDDAEHDRAIADIISGQFEEHIPPPDGSRRNRPTGTAFVFFRQMQQTICRELTINPTPVHEHHQPDLQRVIRTFTNDNVLNHLTNRMYRDYCEEVIWTFALISQLRLREAAEVLAGAQTILAPWQNNQAANRRRSGLFDQARTVAKLHHRICTNVQAAAAGVSMLTTPTYRLAPLG